MKTRTIVSFLAALLVVMMVAVGAVAQSPVTEFDTVLVEKVVATDSIISPDFAASDDLTVGDDLTVSGDAAVTGALTAGTAAVTGAITGASFAGQVAATKLNTTEGADLVVTTGIITPTHSLHFLTATAPVTAGGIANGTNGQMLVLINSSSNAITVTDASNVMLTANAVLGQYDTLTLLYRNPNWYQLATADN